MQLQNRRRLAIVVLILFGLVLAVSIFAIFSSGKTSKKLPPGQYVDSFSHKTVSNPPGIAPEKYGTSPNTPVYLGFDELLNYGLGFDQLKNVEAYFHEYSQAQAEPIGQISVDVDNISTQHDPSNPDSPFDILFRVQFDQASIYQAKVEYFGLNDVRLYLIDPSSSKVIYDSQIK